MRYFAATIKEKNGAILHPEFWGSDNVDEKFLIGWWGLNEPDVESWEIKELTEEEIDKRVKT